MLFGAVAGFSIGVTTGNPWLGLVVAMLAGGLLSLVHAVMTIHLRADQVVSGLALTFLGTGLARVLGEGLSSAGDVAQLPRLTIPVLSGIPFLGPIFFTRPERRSSTSATCSCRSPGSGSSGRGRASTSARSARPRPPPTPRASACTGLRYAYVFIGGMLAGLAGAAITLGDLARLVRRPDRQRAWLDRGRARDLRPVEPAPGRLRGAPVRRRSSGSSSTSRASTTILGVENPFQAGRSATFFLEMLPYLMVILVVVIGSREARPQAGRRAGRARLGRTSAVSGAPEPSVGSSSDVEARELHLDVAARVERRAGAARTASRRRPRADRRELDDHPLVALDEGVDEQLVGPRLELEMLERIDVAA